MKLKRRLLSLALMGSMLISNVAFAFSDTAGHWASSHIESLSSKGIINGYEDGAFKPQNLISREEAAQILSNYIGGSAGDKSVPYDSLGRWSTPAIQNLISKGIINGYEDGTFKPENKITRAEFSTMVYKLLSIQDKLSPSTRSFVDASNHWAKKAIEALAGNGVINGYDDGTFGPDRNITRAEAATIISLAENPKPVQSQNSFQEATVVSVVDGDTIKVSINGHVSTVRMIGVDTPETVHPSKPVGYFGPEASNYTKENLTGKTVYLQRDVSDTDQYGRLLRYVWTSSPNTNEPSTSEIKSWMFNAVLAINGYARPSTFPPDVKYAGLFAELSRPAQEGYWGVWGEPVYEPEPAPVPSPAPQQGLIKGNISSSGEKIYHVPGGAYYAKTEIDTSKGERWFNTEQEAIAAGWRKSSR